MKTIQQFLMTLLMAMVRLCAPQMFRLSSLKVFMMVMCLAMLCVGTGAAQTQSVSLCFEDGDLSQECFEIKNGGQLLKEFAKGSYKYYVLYKDDVNVWYLSSEINRENASDIELFHYESIYDAQTFKADVFGDYTFTVSWDENLKFTLSVTYPEKGSGGDETPTYPALNIGENLVSIGERENVTYSFTAEVPGLYRFHSEGNYNMNIFNFTNSDGTYFEGNYYGDIEANHYNNFDWIFELTEDDTYNLTLSEANGNEVEDYKVYVTYQGTGDADPDDTVLILGENHVNIPSNTVVTYYFTPQIPAKYRFYSEGNGDPEIYDITLDDESVGAGVYVSGDNDIGPDNFNFDLTFELMDGNTYRIVIKELNGRPLINYKVIVSNEDADVQTVSEGLANANLITIPGDPGYSFVAFTAPATSRYQFKSSDPEYTVTLYDDAYADITEFIGCNKGECQLDCTRGQTYYILLEKDDITEDEQIGLSILRAYQREMSYEWGTVCLPFPIGYDPDNGNYKLYKLTDVSSTELTFTELTAGYIALGKPLAVKAVGEADAETGKNTINIVANDSNIGVPYTSKTVVGDYTFKGTFTEMAQQTDVYFIAKNQFWYADDAITIPANRAYLEGPETSANAPLRIVTDDTESITNVSSEDIGVKSRFDLQGRRLGNTRTGLVIENGRVIMVK